MVNESHARNYYNLFMKYLYSFHPLRSIINQLFLRRLSFSLICRYLELEVHFRSLNGDWSFWESMRNLEGLAL